MKKSELRGFKFGFLALGIYLLVQMSSFVDGVFVGVNEAINNDHSLSVIPAVILIVMCLLLTGFILRVAMKHNVVKINKKWNLKFLAILIGVGLISNWIFDYIGVSIMSSMGDGTNTLNQSAIEDRIKVLTPSVMFVQTVIVAPIAEEIVFRGFIPKMFSEKKQVIGLILGAILFGLAHAPTNIGSAVIYIGSGIIHSVVTYFGKRVEYSIVLHAVHNLIAFILTLLSLN